MKILLPVIFLVIYLPIELMAQWVNIPCPDNPYAVGVKGDFLFIGGENGLHRSSNLGITWESTTNGLKSDIWPPTIRAFYSFDNYLLTRVFYLDGGLFKSTDFGLDWTSSKKQVDMYKVVSNGECLIGLNQVLIVRSLDSAYTWQIIDSGITSKTLASGHPVCVAIASSAKTLYTINPEGQVFRSINNGDYWSMVYDHLEGKYIDLYSINDTTIFAYVDNTIYRSTDQGSNWQIVRKGLNGGRKILAAGNNIFVFDKFDVVLSTNNGDTWSPITYNLPDSLNFYDMVVKGNTLFVGAYSQGKLGSGGLWRRPLSDFEAVTAPVQTSAPVLSASNNPFSDDLVLHCSLGSEEYYRLECFDELGRMVYSEPERLCSKGDNQWKIDAALLPRGNIYARLVSRAGRAAELVLVHEK